MKRSSIAKVVLREKQDLLNLPDDFRKAEDFINLMCVLYTPTLCVSTEKNPTCGQILPILQKLEMHFADVEGDTGFVSNLKKQVWANLSKRYQSKDIRNFREMATALDPCFKQKMDNSASVWNQIKREMMTESETTSQQTTKKVSNGGTFCRCGCTKDVITVEEDHVHPGPGREGDADV
ncbi:uncharacterized protein LOC123981923 isoform X3 [Micropterus dolomieu]|uniref:uncharacterized protein LOC123981923 isoform X3 n=1 Tax=Micropterus dolomieu TaxID=147949 RepID=UPI001E8EC13C|nr:uncharacterized protein LOC123981923 isoform X3 [Micropterus dolomieu]